MANGSDSAIAFYQRHALEWIADRNAQQVLMEKPWLERFIALLPTGGTILDIGCGSGRPIAEYLISRGYHVTGIDATPTMIELARANFPAEQWQVADMRTLDLGCRFGGILAWDSFFHLSFDSQRHMFPLFAAHAEPGAPLMFTGGPDHGEAIGQLHGEPLYHASLAQDEYRAMLAANGFAVVEMRMNDPDCGGHSVWLARRVEAR